MSVGKDVSTGESFLTSPLRFLAAFDQYLGDDEVIEASKTYQNCGACTIEIGAILYNVLWLSAGGSNLPLVLGQHNGTYMTLEWFETQRRYCQFPEPSTFRLHACTVRMCRR